MSVSWAGLDLAKKKGTTMPVVLKPDAFQTMAKIGVDSILLGWLKKNAVATLEQDGFTFMTPPSLGSKAAAVPVSVETLIRLFLGTLSAADRMSLVSVLQNAILGLMPKAGAMDMLPKEAVTKALGALKADGTPDPALTAMIAHVEKNMPPAMWSVASKEEMVDLPTVKLRDATRMYLPVMGTSPESRYFVVGGNDDVRLAAKYEGHSLSVRIEGPHWEKHMSSINSLFDKQNLAKGYASIHLTCPTDEIAAKALGAVLLGLGLPLTSPMPDIKRIKGLGA